MSNTLLAPEQLIVSPGFIWGLDLTWISSTQVRIETGGCITESGQVIIVRTPLTLYISGAMNTMYHIYVGLSGSSPFGEISTTAPAATPFFGIAHSKTGDASKRYLGSIITETSGTPIVRFSMLGNLYKYNPVNTDLAGQPPYRVLVAGAATVNTAISCAGVVPVTARFASIFVIQNGTPNLALANSSGRMVAAALGSQRFATDHPLESQNLYYFNLAAGGSANIDVMGYWFEK